MISVVATDIIVQIIEQIIDNISKNVNENKNKKKITDCPCRMNIFSNFTLFIVF